MAELLDLSAQTIASTFDQLLHIGQDGGLAGAGSEHYIADGTNVDTTTGANDIAMEYMAFAAAGP